MNVSTTLSNRWNLTAGSWRLKPDNSWFGFAFTIGFLSYRKHWIKLLPFWLVQPKGNSFSFMLYQLILLGILKIDVRNQKTWPNFWNRIILSFWQLKYIWYFYEGTSTKFIINVNKLISWRMNSLIDSYRNYQLPKSTKCWRKCKPERIV